MSSGRGSHRRGASLVGALVVVAVAGVGPAGVGAPVAGAAAVPRGVSPTTVKVAGITSPAFADAALGAQIRFDQANGAGGVAGRTIAFAGSAADQGSADTGTAEARRLVETEQVFAVVPATTEVLAGDVLRRAKTPVVGLGISSAFCRAGTQWFVAVTGCIAPGVARYASNAWVRSVAALVRAQGQGSTKGKTAALVAEAGAGGDDALRVVPVGAAAAGLQVVLAKELLPAPPALAGDLTPVVTEVMTANGGNPPDVVFLAASLGNVVGVHRALLGAGYRGILTNSRGYSPTQAAAQGGASVFTSFATAESTAPAMQALVAALTPALGGRPISPALLAGYFSADGFVQILEKVGKNLTAARFAKVASRFTYRIPGVVGPTPGRTAGIAMTPCGQMVHSDGGKWTVLVPYRCADLVDLGGTKAKVVRAVP